MTHDPLAALPIPVALMVQRAVLALLFCALAGAAYTVYWRKRRALAGRVQRTGKFSYYRQLGTKEWV